MKSVDSLYENTRRKSKETNNLKVWREKWKKKFLIIHFYFINFFKTGEILKKKKKRNLIIFPENVTNLEEIFIIYD